MARSKTSGDRGERRLQTASPRIVFPAGARWSYTSREDLTVSACGLPSAFREAFWNVLHAARRLFRRLFGPRSIGWVEFNAKMSGGLPLALWTNGADRVYMTLGDKRQLLPAHQSGVFHIHGLAHELGHIVLYRSLVNLSLLADGWGEGWAVYLSSFMAVPYLYRELGPAAWPYSYNFLETEGPARYLRQFAEGGARDFGPTLNSVRALHLLEQKLGRDGFAAFFRRILGQRLHAAKFDSMVLAKLRRS
ncbi:MAG: hypothetical protein ACLQNE_41190 [Thermoguttaceae bacterium]